MLGVGDVLYVTEEFTEGLPEAPSGTVMSLRGIYIARRGPEAWSRLRKVAVGRTEAQTLLSTVQRAVSSLKQSKVKPIAPPRGLVPDKFPARP